MSKVAYFLIDGCEETEAVTPIDILRRGGVQVQMVSLNGEKKSVLSKHNISILAEATLEDWDQEVDMMALTGGTIAYLEQPDFMALLQENAKKGWRWAAICAEPAVFGKLGFWQGKKAVMYPGKESYIAGAEIVEAPVGTDGLSKNSP